MTNRRKIITIAACWVLLSGLFGQQVYVKSPDVIRLTIEEEHNQVTELNITLNKSPGILIINNAFVNGIRFWQQNSKLISDGPENSVFWFYDVDNNVLELKFPKAIDIKTVEFSLISTNSDNSELRVSSINSINSSNQSFSMDQFIIERK